MGTTLPLYAGSYGGALAPGRELISEEWRGRVCNARTIVDTSICICFGLRVSAKISIVCIYIIYNYIYRVAIELWPWFLLVSLQTICSCLSVSLPVFLFLVVSARP